MTDQITIPRETFDQMREALEDLKRQYKDQPSIYMDWSKAREALSAAKAVQPQAQGEADYYADARTWYEWSTQTNWHSPKWDDFSPLGLARVEKEYQDALAVEQAWRLNLKERPLRANDAKSHNIFSDGFHAGSNHSQASEQAKAVQPQPFGWFKQSELDQAKRFGGSINLWLEKYDCDTPVFCHPNPVSQQHRRLLSERDV